MGRGEVRVRVDTPEGATLGECTNVHRGRSRAQKRFGVSSVTGWVLGMCRQIHFLGFDHVGALT